MLYNKIIFKHLPVEINIIVSWCLASLVLLFIFYSGDELSVCLIAVNIYLDATKLIMQCAAPTFWEIPLTDVECCPGWSIVFGPVRGWRKLCFNMNKRKEPPSKQPGIDRFFSKSQRSDGNEESHKTAGRGGRQIPAITASSSSAARGQPVEPSIMLHLHRLVKQRCYFTIYWWCTITYYHSVLSAFLIRKIATFIP